MGRPSSMSWTQAFALGPAFWAFCLMKRAGVSPGVLWQRVQPQPGGGVCSGGRGTPRSDPGQVWALVPGPRRPEGTRGPAAESRRAQPAPPLRPASMSGAHKEPCHASAGEGRAGRDGSRSLLSSFHRKRSVYLENNRKGKRRRGGVERREWIRRSCFRSLPEE